MEYACVLQADGFQAMLLLQPYPQDPEYAHIATSLQLDPSLGSVTLAPARGLIALSDLLRLADYLENHLHCLSTDPATESMTFLTYDLTFQLTASMGAYDPTTDAGAFALLFLINVGRDSQADAGSFVWVGGESNIQVPQVRAFIASIRTAVTGLVTADP